MESRYTFMICRLCLSKSESLTDIFEDSGSHGFIAADIISDFLQLQVSKTDGYPQLVCLKCFDKLIDFKTFKAHCMSAKSIFENKFNSNTSIFHAKYSSKASIDENAVKLDDLRLNVIKNENIDIDEDGNIFEEHNTAMEFCDVVIEAEAEDFGSEDEILQQKEIVTEDKIVSSCPVEIKEEELELSNTDTENSSTTPSQLPFVLMKMSTKRKRVVLSLSDKMDILSELKKGESAKKLAEKYGVGASTISGIKKNSDSILNFVSVLDEEDISSSRKAMKKPENVKLDDAVYTWFLQARSLGQPISGPTLCQKAIYFNEKLGGNRDFKASSGWLRNFKLRHGIREMERETFN